MNNSYQSFAYYHYTNKPSNDPYPVININNCSYGICECRPDSSELLYIECRSISLWTMYRTLLEKYTSAMIIILSSFDSLNLIMWKKSFSIHLVSIISTHSLYTMSFFVSRTWYVNCSI